jgi:23S rRNA pseudouridine955/2504/2580 synthase
MPEVATYEVAPDEADLRLDRWFKRHFPGLAHGRLEKFLRTGQVRVDGHRAKARHRLVPGQRVRVPPLAEEGRNERPAPAAPRARSEDLALVRSAVLYRDDDILALNKPPGLAVQGGTKVTRHLDSLLDGLRFEAAERPRLVHRLDRDTSGVLLLARNAAAAARLAQAFRGKALRKVYWAVVVGKPRMARGKIDLPLAKVAGPEGERVQAEAGEGRSATTYYVVVESAGKRASWLALLPLTGRTHQLRVHCAALGTPILGDGKYGGRAAFLEGPGLSPLLHLHAREMVLPRELVGRRTPLRIVAPLPAHMAATFRALGFAQEPVSDPFADLELGG